MTVQAALGKDETDEVFLRVTPGLFVEAFSVEPPEPADWDGWRRLFARQGGVFDRPVILLIDEVIAALPEHDFLVALPSLRLAFTYFPPRERAVIAERVLRKRGVQGGVQALLRLVALCGLGGNACACNCRWHRLQNLPSDMTAATVVSDNVTLRSVSLSRNGWRSTPVRGQLSGAQGLLA